MITNSISRLSIHELNFNQFLLRKRLKRSSRFD